MKSLHVLLPVCALFLAFSAYAQQAHPDIAKYLAMIEGGQADQVRTELPSLLSQYPNNPVVLYVQAAVTKDGAQAVRIYQSIVDNFPTSEWADDALYRVYQFYYALGLYRTAEMKFAQLRKSYPTSKYIKDGSEVQTRGFVEEKDESAASETSEAVREQPAVAPPVPSGPAGIPARFALQVGAYSSQENAHKQKLFFENAGFPVGVFTKVKDGRSLYTVVVGSYGSYDEARVEGEELKKKYNIDSIVVTH